MSRSTLLLCCALTTVLTTVGCSSDTSGTAAPARLPAASPTPDAATTPATEPTEAAPTSPEAAAPARIVIAGFDYEVPASVAAGAAVEVVNEDEQAHTVSLAGTDVSVVVQGGETTQLTAPAQAGSYPVACQFHGNMSATLVVV